MFEFKAFIVLFGLMEMRIYKRDLAIIKNLDVDVNTLKEKDIIAFRDKDDYVVTYKVVEKNNRIKEFVTKGDNSNSNDGGIVSLDKVDSKDRSKTSNFDCCYRNSLINDW